MRNVSLAPVSDKVVEMEKLYGPFEIGFDGVPNTAWEGYHLRKLPLPESLQLAFFPAMWLRELRCNRRMLGALEGALLEVKKTWPLAAREAHGLNQFVKCYCFGDGDSPNLHWYGAAWQLSPKVGGEILTEAIKIFTRHGFTWMGQEDKKRIRSFEYW
jgi:hypothetical protein